MVVANVWRATCVVRFLSILQSVAICFRYEFIVWLQNKGKQTSFSIQSEKPNQDRIDNDLKYRYIKMKGDASAEQIATLENIFEINRNTEAIEQMREDVETYEEAVRKQAALAEQARLKEQAAKEQESKAKSIKAK